MRVVVLNEIPRDDKLAQQWDELVFQMEQPEVFYTYEWALAASHSLGASAKPLLMLVYETSLIGVTALVIPSETGNRVHFLGEKTADYCDLISKPAERPKVVEAVFQELRRLGKSNFVMSNIPEESATRDYIRASGQRCGYYLLKTGTDIYPRVNLGDSNSRIALKQSLNGKKTLRNLYRALNRMGSVELSHSKDGGADGRYLSDFFQAHIARFLATGRVSPYICSNRRQFLLTLSELLSSKGWLTVSELSLNKRTIASHIGFEFAGKCFWYMPTFNIEYERFGPGMHLLKSFLEMAIDLPSISVVDLGLGDENYKKRFANSQQHITQLIVTNSWGQYLRLLIKTLFVKMLKRSRWVEQCAHTYAELVTGASKRLQKEGWRILIQKVLKKAKSVVYSRNALSFFEWPGLKLSPQDMRNLAGVKLQPLDWTTLAKAAIHHENDGETVSYLIRAGERLLKGEAQGFAVMAEDGIPVHFCWVSDFDGFLFEEVGSALKAPNDNSVILFDCWTPTSVRGQGYYPMALGLVAEQFSNIGKIPWISSAVLNFRSIHGIEKAGFERSFCATNIRILFKNFMRIRP